MNQGKITNLNGQWLIQIPVHPKSVEQIKSLECVFDNVEARILTDPNVSFKIQDGMALIHPIHFGSDVGYPVEGVFGNHTESITFDSEEDRRIFFEALES